VSALQWVIVVQVALGSLATVFMIGRERKPITPGGAAITLLVNIIIVALALTVFAP
jgi:hypothetical protein